MEQGVREGPQKRDHFEMNGVGAQKTFQSRVFPGVEMSHFEVGIAFWLFVRTLSLLPIDFWKLEALPAFVQAGVAVKESLKEFAKSQEAKLGEAGHLDEAFAGVDI